MPDKNSSNNNNELKHSDMHNSEYSNFEKRRARFTVESSNTKPFDINKMTGTSSTNNNREG